MLQELRGFSVFKMERIILNKALNKEIKYYGLSYLGMLGACVIGAVIWTCLGMICGILGLGVGYMFAAMLARHWHSGAIQKALYWHLPTSQLFGSKYLPESHKRCFM